MTEPNGRPAASNVRQLLEGAAILTPIATIVGWLVTLLPVQIPDGVQSAIVALVVTLGSVGFSELRNRGRLGATVGTGGLVFPMIFLVFLVGCVTWNGDAYRKLAGDEIVALSEAPSDTALNADRCLALDLGAIALRDDQGGSRSINAPFFSGQHVDGMARIHEEQSAVCTELETRDADRGVAPALRDRNRAAWVKTWKNGRALLGGGEE